MKGWTRSYNLILSLVGLLSSLVPRWDFHTLLTDPLPRGRYYLLIKTWIIATWLYLSHLTGSPDPIYQSYF